METAIDLKPEYKGAVEKALSHYVKGITSSKIFIQDLKAIEDRLQYRYGDNKQLWFKFPDSPKSMDIKDLQKDLSVIMERAEYVLIIETYFS